MTALAQGLFSSSAPVAGNPGLAMPDQDLNAPFHDPGAPGVRTDGATRQRRAWTLALSLGVTLGLGGLWLGWFAQEGSLTLGEALLTAVSAFAGFWMVLSVATATLGLFWRPAPQVQPLQGLRVAILLPICGEPAEPTIGHAVALLAALSPLRRHPFSLHILSDTRDRVRARIEEAQVLRHAHPALHYRRRKKNIDYKSGNIRDWVQSHGAGYDAILILDADSIMGAQTVIKMADLLACEPGLGLVQSLPRILPGQSLWQGLQAFASEVYGINMGRGFAMWAGEEGNFLGHNAMIRLRAFATSAGLPHLPGRAPRGGVILSHDFVEAALLRRAGWGVRIMAGAEESFEATPETLFGHLRRDRRWCQGNMQHLRLLGVPGLHPMSRFHLLQGAMSYLASVWWLILLGLWALPGPDQAPSALGAVLAVLLAPKALGIAGHIRDHGLDNAPRLVLMALAEIVISALLAPLQMVHQLRAVLRSLAGIDGGWQPHATGTLALGQLMRFHATETLLGAGLLALWALGLVSAWLLPVAISLFLSAGLAALVQMPLRAFSFVTKQRVAA